MANEDSADLQKVAAGFMDQFIKLLMLMLLFLLLGFCFQISNFGASHAAALRTKRKEEEE